jgi:hypothetical protein
VLLSAPLIKVDKFVVGNRRKKLDHVSELSDHSVRATLMDKEPTSSTNAGRRDFIKKAAYVAPAVLTLAVAPAYAKAGSHKPESKPKNKPEKKPKKKK